MFEILQMLVGLFICYLFINFVFSPTGVAIWDSMFVGWLGWLVYERIKEG